MLFQRNKWLIVFLMCVVPPLMFSFFLESPYKEVISIFVSVILLWLSEIIPLGVTAFLIPCVIVVYGLVEAEHAFLAFGNRIIFLFVGVFLLARGLERSGLLTRIASKCLLKAPWDHTPRTLTIFIAGLAWLASMWMSNTAACAVLVPLALGMAMKVSSSLESHESRDKLVTRLLIACAFGASIGGIATPIGSPPNLLALEYIARLDKTVSFVQWLVIGLPLSLVMLLTLVLLLEVLFPMSKAAFPSLNSYLEEEMLKKGKWSVEERIAGSCFLFAVCFWLAPGLLQFIAPESVITQQILRICTIEIVALVAASALFFLSGSSAVGSSGILSVEDLKAIDWNTILLFGGGLTLGNLLSETGVAREIGLALGSQFGENYILFGVACCVFAVLASEFSSNTASAAILLPIVVGALQFSGVLEELTLAVAFAASYGFMLPVSTPPNAIAYGTGQLKLAHLVKAGFLFDIIGLVLISLCILVLLPLFGVV